MIIDHNKSLPKSEALLSQHPTRALPLYLTNLHHNRQPNLSKCTPTKLIRALLTKPSETTPSDPLLAMVHQSFTPLMMMLQTSPRFFQPRGLDRSKSVNATSFQHANHTNNQLVDRGANGGLAGSDMRVIYKPHRKINISGIDNHEVTGLMWSLLQPSSTPLWEKSLVSSMNMPTLGRIIHPFIRLP